MSVVTASRSSRPPGAIGRNTVSQAIAVFIALATGTSGCWALVAHSEASGPEHILAPAGVALILAALVQIRLIVSAWQQRTVDLLCCPLGSVSFWRALLASGFVVYLALLLIGPARNIGFAWLAAVAASYTLLLWPAAARPYVLGHCRRWSQGRAGNQVVLLVIWSMLILVSLEGSLRIYGAAQENGWCFQSQAPPGQIEGNAPVTSNISIEPRRPGVFRVAVAAERAKLEVAGGNGCLLRVQQMLPGLEVVPIALDQPWSRESTEELAERLPAAKADLLLVMVSVCEDMPRRACNRSLFDWRRFAMSETLLGTRSSEAATKPARRQPSGKDNFEEFLDRLAPQLASCRAPQDEATRVLWQQAFTSLDRVLDGCRAQKLPVALVLVPGQFQVNTMLAETLARRQGYAAGQLDLELPQRRWTGFAEPRKVPLVDLLGPLRLCRQAAYERNEQAWNDTGNATAAAAIGGWLESRYGRQLSVAAQLTSSP